MKISDLFVVSIVREGFGERVSFIYGSYIAADSMFLFQNKCNISVVINETPELFSEYS
jgi:hypothetical protein